MSSESSESALWNSDDFEWEDDAFADDQEFEPPQFSGSGSRTATDRLLKDLRSFSGEFGIRAQPLGDNLYEWEVEFFDFDGALAQDLAHVNCESVELRVSFGEDYPFKPPFARVVRPRFQFHTGHVTVGGSICMEALTLSGWLPSNDIESLLVQIRSEMIAGGARLDLTRRDDYTETEARQAFERVARDHNWQ